MIASATLLTLLVMSVVSGMFLNALGRVSPLSVALLMLSLAYPVVVLIGATYLFKAKARERLNLPYWFAAAFVIVHLLIAGYMAMYGAIGVPSWA